MFLKRKLVTLTGIIRLPGCECLTKPIKISSRKFSMYLDKVSEKIPSPVTEEFLLETEIAKY
jgi:hypothetical protein